MKAIVLFISIMAVLLTVIPMAAVSYPIPAAQEAAAPVHEPPVTISPPASAPKPESEPPESLDDIEGMVPVDELHNVIAVSESEPVTSFKVLDASTGKVSEISLKDFVRGAVAAEMPVSFHSEALKAQAVAAHTFALRSHIAQQQSPNPELKGADFEADPENMKVYITEKTAKKFYGKNGDQYWDKICEAADSVADYVLEYDGEPIVAAYHAISSGMTEDAGNIWDGGAPYLVPVISEGDLIAPGFETTVTFTDDEVKSMLKKEFPDISLSSDADEWFGIPERSESGYVTEIELGDKILHGKDIRRILDLRSHNFEINRADGNFIFTVTGYGHGVGLSQYGADFLARQGKGFGEILSAYYPGSTLTVME